MTPALLLKFLNANGNILTALSASSPTSSALSSLLLELDIHLPPDRTSLVVDHFNYDELASSEQHDVLLLPRPGPLRPDVVNYFGGDKDDLIAFPRAVGQVLGNDSPLLAPLLRAPSTAYAYNPKDEAATVEEPFGTGQQLSLVSTMQARNSARFVVLGSVEMLEDAWFAAQVKRGSGPGNSKKQATANRAFAKEISAWAFKELGVLQVGRIEHHHNTPDEKPSRNTTALMTADSNPKIYRVKSDVVSAIHPSRPPLPLEKHVLIRKKSQTFSIELSEYVYDHYRPFSPPDGDEVQLEFTMLSPFHRLRLQRSTPPTSSNNATVFTTAFTLPDQHGIFAFRVNYKRPFLSNVDEKRTVTVRHFAHDEWPRSWRISGAWVWIAGIWTTVASWLVFVALWLWSAPPKNPGGKKLQ